MAQSQAEGRGVSTTNMPAMASRGGPLATRDFQGWGAAGPFGLMRRLSDDLDMLFGELVSGGDAARRGAGAFAPTLISAAADWMPAIEVFERDNELVVQADLPGVGAEDVTVEVIDGFLTVSGERREEQEVEDNGFRRTERRYGRFSRVIALPEEARTDNIQAIVRDGVLEIRVPLERQTSRRRSIEVQKAQGGQSAQSGQNTQRAQSSSSREASSATAGRSGSSRERGDGAKEKTGNASSASSASPSSPGA